MDCKPTSTNTPRGRQSAFTLVELMIGLAISMILVTALAALSFYSARSIAAMTNYVDLDDKSRNALDRMTRDIRQVQNLSTFATNALSFVDSDGATLTYSWDPSTKKLSRIKSGTTEVLLSECDTLTFAVYQRNPVAGTYDQYPVATNNYINTCKLVQVNWTCSRKIMATVANTESVQTAKIVIRKQ